MRKGRHYVTVVLDADTRRLLYLAPGRSGQALAEFKEALLERGGDPLRIGTVVMDMLHCYKRGVRECFPRAQVIYDRFHVMVMAGEAVELVRRGLQREGADLKGSLWVLRGNPWNLSEDKQALRERLGKQYKALGRALARRRALQDVYAASGGDGPQILTWWFSWKKRSRLPSFVKLAECIKTNWAGIVAYFSKRYTRGPLRSGQRDHSVGQTEGTELPQCELFARRRLLDRRQDQSCYANHFTHLKQRRGRYVD